MCRRIDWAVVFKRVKKELTTKKTAQLTGLSTSVIEKYAGERHEVKEEHDKYVKAMLLYLHVTEQDIPIVGEYYADMCE